MGKIRAVGFDFDGTLIMSEEVKAKEFAKVFLEKFHVRLGVERAYTQISKEGKSRDAKTRALFRRFLKREPTVRELRVIHQHFSEHYKRSLRTCPLFACTNIIKELKKQVDFLFLLSLEEKKDVVMLLKHCGLYSYFDEVLGGPANKVENLRHVLQKHHVKPSEVMYIGDKTSDVIASRKVHVKMVLVNNKFNYEYIHQKLRADFKFSSLCDVPIDITTS